ncbi:MAG: hypothetical protein WC753_03545 [Candidatus Gracilibacteria bacterium]
MSETPKDSSPVVPAKKDLPKQGESVGNNHESLKKSPETTEKPEEKLVSINKKVQDTYNSYATDRARLASGKKDSSEKGAHDDEDEKKAQEQLRIKEDAFKTIEKTYQEAIASDVTAKKEESTSEEQKKIEGAFLTKSVTDLHYSTEPLDESRVQFLAKTFPEAWKDAIVNPNIDLRSNTELAVVRERIQGKLRTTEEEILKNSAGLSKEEVTKKLAENFQKVTGISTNQETFKKYVSEQVDSLPVDRGGRDTSSESFSPSATQGFSAGGSADVPSADNGAGDIPPVEASQMTIASYQWQGSGFKMRGPLKDLPKGTKGPPSLLAKLAKQGTNPGGSTGTCYKSVKNHLCAAGYVESSYKMTQGSAQNAASDLQSIGFSNVGPNIGNAQVGDVCVYSGGAHGHIEIKTGDGYASDFFASHPSGRKLIGVWRPPVSAPVSPQDIAGTDKNSQMS